MGRNINNSQDAWITPEGAFLNAPNRRHKIRHYYKVVLTSIIIFTSLVGAASALTIFYAGEEHGQLGPHGCGVEQVGGLANRYTLVENLYIKHPSAVLNLHTGNLIAVSDPNSEWVYQIGLSALEMLKVDIFCLGPQELSLPEETISALHASYPSIRITCGNLENDSVSRYLIESVDSSSMAVISLLSQIHAKSLPDVSLIPPENALSTLRLWSFDSGRCRFTGRYQSVCVCYDCVLHLLYDACGS